MSLFQSSEPPLGIALFDLDGTLVAWDCQLLFRHFVVRREPWRVVLLPVFLILLPFFGILKTAGMKRVFLSYLWRMKPEALADHSRDFASFMMPSIYPELRQQLESHRQRGHLLILASASPEFYVAEIGRTLGFDLTLGTPVTTEPACPLFPPLENHKGAAKVARLREVLPAACFADGKLVNSHGYTDSRADLPMLAICQTATVVNPTPELTALAEQNRWQIVRPARPWRTRVGFAVRTLGLLTGIGADPGGVSDASGS